MQASDYIRSAIFDRSSEWHTIGLLYGIVIGYLVVYLILIVCYLIGETSTQRSVFVSIGRYLHPEWVLRSCENKITQCKSYLNFISCHFIIFINVSPTGVIPLIGEVDVKITIIKS